MSLDLAQFHATFFDESFEALESMELALLKLSPGKAEAELVNTIFRAAHSIKGAAAIFGFAQVTSFTHAVETYLDALRGGRLAVSQQGIDQLLKAIDLLRALLLGMQQGGSVDPQPIEALQSELEQLLRATGAQESLGSERGTAGVSASALEAGHVCGAALSAGGWRIDFRPHLELLQQGNDVVRLFAELERLGTLACRADIGRLPSLTAMRPEHCYLSWELEVQGKIDQTAVEEIFTWVADDCRVAIEPIEAADASTLRPSAFRPSGEPPRDRIAESPTDAPAAAFAESGSIRVSTDKLDDLINRVGELVIIQSMLNTLASGADAAEAGRLQVGLEQLERNTRELQESVMRMRMLPVNVVFARFPRMVRDLGRKLDKRVQLTLCGEQTELDKGVLEKISDPLVHLLRNAIDHGIETPERRRQLGKPETGQLDLEACHKSGRIRICLSDDGAGLDREKILGKARSAGLVGDEELSDEAICDLIFHPGLSTADKTTDLSGRGVGMDVVRRNIRALGGSVEVSSQPGLGTTFSIVLPLTMAIMDGQSVVLGDERYIIPLASIVESLQPKPELIANVGARNELLLFRDKYVPVLRLDELLGTRIHRRALTEGLIVIVENDECHLGIVVDDLLGQQQIVIKSLEENYQKVEGISGATILGGGSIALILDIPELIRIAERRETA